MFVTNIFPVDVVKDFIKKYFYNTAVNESKMHNLRHRLFKIELRSNHLISHAEHTDYIY